MSSALMAGWKAASIYNPATGDVVQLNKLALELSGCTEENITTDTTQSRIYGGKSYELKLAFLDDTGLSQLETWMLDRTPVQAVASGDTNLQWYESEPLEIVKMPKADKRTGLNIYVVTMTHRSANPAIYQNQNLLAFGGASLSSLNVASQTTVPANIFWKPDGLKFWVLGNFGGSVFEYAVSTAWDVSTASYSGNSFSVASEENSPANIFWKSDGSQFWIVGSTLDTIFEYAVSTAWDVTTAGYLGDSKNVTSEDATPAVVFWKPDGLKLWVLGTTNRRIFEYNAANAFVITSVSYSGTSFDVASEELTPRGLFWKSDGSQFWIVGSAADTIYSYTVSTAWDISTASYSGNSFSIGSYASIPRAIFWKSDGLKFWITGSTTQTVYEFNVGTAWDVTTAFFVQYSVQFPISGVDLRASALYASIAGTVTNSISVTTINDTPILAAQKTISSNGIDSNDITSIATTHNVEVDFKGNGTATVTFPALTTNGKLTSGTALLP